MSKQAKLVRLWKRPSRDGKSYTYYLRYTDLDGNFRVPSLGHNDAKKAQKQMLAKEKELMMGFCPSSSMKLSEFVEDSLIRTGSQIRESTKTEYRIAMNHLVNVIGNIDIQSISHKHGEKFRQACLDHGNAPDTAAKKIRTAKLMFELGVKRGQLDENPFRNVKPPKLQKNRKIHTYRPDECNRLIKAASQIQKEWVLEWDLFLTFALTTAMRKSEILNLVWSDVDFDKKTVDITPKENTEHLWAWQIKDTECRTVPLTESVVTLLANLQQRRPIGYPYIFVPPKRYDRIQNTRKGLSKRAKNNWTLKDANNSIINGFNSMFEDIKKRAGIEKGSFHDFRRTAITNWFYGGLETTEVMRLAGHSNFETTINYYLTVKDGLMDKARQAVSHSVSPELLERCNFKG